MKFASPSQLRFVIVAILAASASQAEPQALSTAMLDGVTAGSETVASNENGSTHPSVIVGDSSTVEVNSLRAIELRDAAQTRGAAMNVVNSAQSDVANAMNIVQADAASLTNQVNDIAQSERRGGQALSIKRGANLLSAHQESSGFDNSNSSASTNTQSLLSISRRSYVDTFNAQVPGYFPLQNLSVTIGTPKLPSVTVPKFGFDLTTTDDVGGIYGIRGSLGPFYFDPPQIVLGTVSLSGNDVVIKGGFVDLPSLDLGHAKIDFCVVKCGGIDVDLPTIDGPHIDFGSELRLKDANPFKDVRLNAGGGLAVAGRGHIRVDLGHVTLGASVSLDIPDLTTSFSFDVLGHTVDTGKFGIEIPAIDASINLIDADIGVAYTADFNGALCLSIVTTSCQGLKHQENIEESHIEIVRTTSTATQASSSHNESHGFETLTVSASMNGAEADLIAMSEGNAKLDTTSVVQLDAQAQRGMTVINAINATGAMVGNSLNVAAQTSASSAGGLSQNNTFNQFQTRPRGR